MNGTISSYSLIDPESIVPITNIEKTQAPIPNQTIFGKHSDLFKEEWGVRCAADRGRSFRQNGRAGLCQRCGKPRLRYVHELERPGVEGQIEVGKECARILCPSYNAERAERCLKNRDRRLNRWMKGWQPGLVGNQYLNGWNYEVGVMQCNPGFRWWITGHVHIWSEITYRTCREAQHSLFDYLNSRNMLGDDPLPAGSFSLTQAFREIERIRQEWFKPFSRGPKDWFFTAFITNLGRVSCTIYQESPLKWNYLLVIPKPSKANEESVRLSGSDAAYESAGLAKIDALCEFQDMMPTIVYEMAGLEPGPGLLPLSEADRQEILIYQAEEEQREERRKAEEELRIAREEELKLAIEKEQRQRQQWEQELRIENYANALDHRQGTRQPPRSPAVRFQKSRETIHSYQERLNNLASPKSMLNDAVARLCSNWNDYFKQSQKGYTASLPIDTLTAQCNVFRRGSESWGVGIFMPFGIIGPFWSNGSTGDTAEDAIANAKEIFRSVAIKWIEEVVPM